MQPDAAPPPACNRHTTSRGEPQPMRRSPRGWECPKCCIERAAAGNARRAERAERRGYR